jgi:glycosyltransferase involved in cell wall biosynthesis
MMDERDIHRAAGPMPAACPPLKVSIALGPFHPAPPAGYGAVEKVWWSLAGALARAGHNVSIVAKGPLDASVFGDASRKVQTLPMRGFSASRSLALNLIKDLAYALKVTRTLPTGADVVVTNSFWLPVLLKPLRRSKGRIIVHAGRFPKGQMRLYCGVDMVHTVSSVVAEAIERQSSCLSGRVMIVGYPIETEVFVPAVGRPPGEAILFIGRVHPEKGVHLLIDAFRLVAEALPGATLSVVGPWEPERGGGGKQYLDALVIKAAGLPVRFEPAITDEHALAARYADCDVFCYPSLAEKGETFGRAVLEAMACAVPCVVSSLACFTDFFADGSHGLVFDHRAAQPERELASKLLRLLTAPHSRVEMASAARCTSLEYSLDRLTPAYIEMLYAVASRC